jgi:hypothetical protein
MPLRPRCRWARLLQAVRHVHFQHITLQHGVVGIALHFNAVVGKDVAVVFDVLAELFRCRVLPARV